MEVSNVSHYDGATAVAEAVIMALQVGRNKRCNIILSPTLNPQYRQVVHTYTQGMCATTVGENAPLGDLNALAELVDKNAACVIVQNPDFLGRLYMPSEMQALAERVHAAGALLIVAVDPISLGLFTPPGQYGGLAWRGPADGQRPEFRRPYRASSR
jgi:glycine dehydrogenase subunit 1